MMFSSHIDMICKNSAFLDIFVKLKVVSEYISTNSGIHHQFRIITKGAKPLNFSKALYGQHAFLI